MNILILPSYTSVWNPIEKVFAEIKKEVYNKKINVREELVDLIQSSLCRYDQNHFRETVKYTIRSLYDFLQTLEFKLI